MVSKDQLALASDPRAVGERCCLTKVILSALASPHAQADVILIVQVAVEKVKHPKHRAAATDKCTRV